MGEELRELRTRAGRPRPVAIGRDLGLAVVEAMAVGVPVGPARSVRCPSRATRGRRAGDEEALAGVAAALRRRGGRRGGVLARREAAPPAAVAGRAARGLTLGAGGLLGLVGGRGCLGRWHRRRRRRLRRRRPRARVSGTGRAG